MWHFALVAGKRGYGLWSWPVLLFCCATSLPPRCASPCLSACVLHETPDIASLVTIVNGYRGGMYGFFSSHAANAAGIVTFTSLLFRNRLYTVTAVIWALLTCYSRMYLGVHYPGDIVVGLLWGTFVGWGKLSLIYVWTDHGSVMPGRQPYAGSSQVRLVNRCCICDFPVYTRGCSCPELFLALTL